MTEQEKRLHRCAFTGHRPEKLTVPRSKICEMLEEEIRSAVDDGMNVFITGMARGVDIWAAHIVFRLRSGNSNIKLICAPPYEGFESRWSEDNQNDYRLILQYADLVRYICPRYSPDCFQRRNEWMVDHANRLIAVWNGLPSGTANTVRYAQSQEVDTRIIKV